VAQFIRCPQCGALEELRTQCACGYPDGVSTTPTAPSTESISREPAVPPSKFDRNDEVSPFRKTDEVAKAGDESDLKPRLLGLVFLGLGCFLAYFSIYRPYEAAENHEEKISLSLKGAFFCPLSIAIGLAMLILGKRSRELFGTRERSKPFAWIFGLTFIALGAGIYFLLRSYLQDQGYQF
jgi:hypothetical protein